eukprot:757153-Hanusia_phi.AAC.6
MAANSKSTMATNTTAWSDLTILEEASTVLLMDMKAARESGGSLAAAMSGPRILFPEPDRPAPGWAPAGPDNRTTVTGSRVLSEPGNRPAARRRRLPSSGISGTVT